MKKFNEIKRREELLNFEMLTEVLTMKNEERKAVILNFLRDKAKQLSITQELEEEIRKLNRIIQRDKLEKRKRLLIGQDFRTDAGGRLLKTVGNYLIILNSYEEFGSLRYNLLSGRPEWKGRSWDDECFSRALHIIESEYSLKSESDLNHALKIFWNINQYHPIRERIEELQWDGKSRIEGFLGEIMQADDTEYTRECSRLIFHCGIKRVFEPGCKADDIIVLQGKQGNGKTTITQWLAMNYDWYGRVSEIRGNTGIEQIQGKWICEVSELLALNSDEKQEEAKQYFDRRSDNYRKPYSIYPSDIPRQCIFIGTTNLRQPFKDKTGNRRYYPVWCNVERGVIYEKEEYIKAYIEQCWAEAYQLYNEGKIFTAPRKELLSVVTDIQSSALEDDWRVGAIEKYIADKDCVCVLELWDKALGFRDKPTIKQSTADYGRQRCWLKTIPYDDIDIF